VRVKSNPDVPGIIWANTFFRGNKPMAEFTASDGADKPPTVKF
jgi:LemA protein